MSGRLRNKLTWPFIIAVGLLIGGVIGWRVQAALSPAVGHDEPDSLCPYWDPVGIGSWGMANSLEDFKDADLVVKVKVAGHRIVEDAYKMVPDGRSRTDTFLVNDLEVLEVFKGEPRGKVISASSGGGVCFTSGDVYYLFLMEPGVGVYADPYEDDPEKQQPAAAYYVLHPFAQYLVEYGKIEVSEALGPEVFPVRYHGVSEAAFAEELRRTLRTSP